MSIEIKSLWIATTPNTNYAPLEGDINVDVAIVGGGISGLTAALLLKRAGKRVAVVDMSHIANGESGFTTAHLTEVLDTRFHTLISHFGKDGARMAAASSRAAIDKIEEIIRSENIECDFQRLPGYLYCENAAEVKEVEREVNSAIEIGVGASLAYEVPLPFHIVAAMRVNHQAQFHPRKYLLPLAEKIHGEGSFIFEQTRVTAVEDGNPSVVQTDHGTIKADAVIVAANSPMLNWVFLHTKIASYRTYAIGATLRSGDNGAPGLFWDTASPYHYTRVETIVNSNGQPDRILIVGGEDHKTGTNGDTQECFARLESYARAHFEIDSIPYHWSGQILNPCDGLPYIGRNSLSKHVYVATGFSGNGMTFGTLAGMLLSDEILGRKNEWSQLYDATRIHPLASIAEYLSENKDFPAYFVGDRFAKADGDSVEAVKTGEGKIVKIDGEKFAVYRDEQGAIHSLSPVCTHMACYVHWNSAEKTWDCPCHGSRFDPDGKLLNGPAVTDLKPAHLPQIAQI